MTAPAQVTSINASDGATATLSRFIAGINLADIPKDVVTRAKYIMLDGFACGLFGAKLDWSKLAVETLIELDGSGPAKVWGWNRGVTPMTAALLNGTFVQGFELDDYHPYGPLHSGSIVLPAVLGTAEGLGKMDGKRFLEAVIAGFETGPRVGMALGGLDLIARGWHCGSVYGTFASAAGVGKLRRLNAEKMEDAFGIAATQSCGLMAAQFEAMVKRMHHGFAARSGVLAGALADRGFTGIKGVIERDYGGMASQYCDGPPKLKFITEGLGDTWEVRRIAIKPAYACMGGLHATIEACEAIRARPGFSLRDIESIRVGLAEALFHHGGWKLLRPATGIGAQMNNAYAAAVTMIDGVSSPAQYSPQRINQDDVWRLIERVSVHHDADIDGYGQDGRFCSRVKITYKNGRVEEAEVRSPLGGRARPLTEQDISSKYDLVMKFVTDDAHARKLKEMVLNIEACPDVTELAGLLGAEVRPPFAE